MDEHDPPPKRRRLRPIENLDWSLFEGMEAILKGEQAFADAPKENGHDASAPAAEEPKLQENGHDVSAPAAEKQPKLQAEAILDAATAEDKEVVTTNTNKVIAAIPSAAKSRPRAKRKAKQEESAVADVPTVDLSENGHDVSAPAAEKQPKLQAEAILDAATAEDKEVVTTNTNKVIAAIPSAAKSRPRAKRKAKQEESAVADVPTVDLSENGHDVSAPAEKKAEATLDAATPEDKVVTTNTNKVIAAIASAAKLRPRAKRKAKQEDEAPLVTDAAEPFPAKPAANGVTNGAPEHLKEPILESALMVNLEETKPVETETAAKARPRAKRKAKQVESKMVAEASENLPKEVDEKSAEKPSEAECSKEEGKKKSEAAPKRPRAKRKAKKAEDAIVIDDAEPCLSPDTNGVTNGEQHSEEQAASTSTVTDDAKAVANTVPENQAAEDLAKDGVEPEASTLSSGTAEPPQEAKADHVAEILEADEGPAASSSGPPLEGEGEEPDTADAADAADAAEDPTPFTVPLPRRRRRVKLRRRRQADFFVPEAALFQPLGDPDSPQEQAFEAPPGPDPLKEAEEVLSELLQQQALMCKEVRISIEDRLQEVFEEWRCLHNRINTSAEYCVRQVLDAVSQNQHADATTLGLAIEEAQQLGLPERKAITERLEELKKLEEVEGVWQCLSTCLRDADRLGVVFWSKEAEDLGLEVPEVLMPALDAMRDEEAARLKRMELEASFNAQAAEAHAHKDVQALQAMAQHAKASGQDPSAALAALEDLGAEEAEEEELERLFVSSPNGQNHCFGMYVLVKEERGNGMPVWRQLGGERWIYTDELGRWTVGSSKVRQNGFRGSAGFIFCPQKNHGVLPDKMQFWARFDEEAKKWKKDEDITIASEYQEEVIEPKFSKRAKGRAAKKSAKGKGKGGKGKEEKAKARAKPKAAPRPEAKAHARPAFAQPAHHSGLTQPQAMRILELPPDRLCDLREEVINKAYRRLALRWHPDRHCNRHKKEEANAKFVELRNAFELMRDFLKAKKPIQDGAL